MRLLNVEHTMYIDPAAGSLVLQVVAAVALSSLAFASRVRQRAGMFLRTLFHRRDR